MNELFLLVAGLVSDGEGESESRVLVNGAAPVFTTHPTDRSETWRETRIDFILFLLHHCSFQQNQCWLISKN